MNRLLRIHFRKLLFCAIAIFFASCAIAQEEALSDTAYLEEPGVQRHQDSLIFRQESDHNSGSSSETRKVPDSIVSRYKSDKDFAYANDPSFWKKEPPPDNSAVIKLVDWLSRSPIVRWILYLLLATIILFAIYQVMVVNDFFLFRSRGTKQAHVNEHSDEPAPSDLDKLIAEAISKKHYRIAIRYLYLKTLHLLHERQLIQLNAKSTNQDYVAQMLRKRNGADFKRLTSIYEYAWYGEYALTDQQFDVALNNFNRFMQQAQ